ncbi:sucrose phosphorylase [Salisediminibacterium selenitireducens]|uniref:Sucrose phosphorylase n=1 Tax=Bacillus selenitireducens (strain ATCC 700615 / DSM 15326 / MLS10) TaxID=439292 RepID=D6XVK0_BACIE|nr:sucrose phosphorylase [Salisediminibacterium selenitireducens]ADH99738.1 alpha amylase catalytic region [[Bacillus] selenitireducens MLS10]
MTVKNEIMLITYADSLGKNLKELDEVLETHFKDAVGGVHLLPFYPSSADRGFAPMTYQEVDPAFGGWSDVERIAKKYDTMYDFMINHISKSSEYFQDFMEKKDDSPYADLFIQYKDFWPGGEPTQEDVDKIYKRKPRAPYIDVTFGDGSTEKIWCTFDEEQIDLNVYHERTKAFMRENLTFLAEKGASIIRLDAFAYATKKPGTDCFFLEPDTWEMLDEIQTILEPIGCEILPEIHEHYTIQLKLAERGYYVYDFALPMLVLHALYSGRTDRLAHWLNIAPRKQYTTLDTHDGIGVVDVADLMTQEEIEATRDDLFTKGANVKRVYNTMEYNNLDIYQLNCTYYSALGDDDQAYLLARAIQFFAPGIPQVYYVGLLAGKNDIELLEETKVGRNINRHYYTKEEIAEEMKRPVMAKFMKLMTFRNDYKAFDDQIDITEREDGQVLEIVRTTGDNQAILTANVETHAFTITYKDEQTGDMKELVL